MIGPDLPGSSGEVTPVPDEPRLQSPRRFPFPKHYRLTKTDEFSSVFGFRRAIKSPHFLLHWRERGGEETLQGARLGLVVGKKLCRASVGRNRVKRLARESFRLHREALPPVDLILRLGVSLDKANPRPSKADMAGEIAGLLRRLIRRLAAPQDAGSSQPATSPAPSEPRS